jgi:hypothetical protein
MDSKGLKKPGFVRVDYKGVAEPDLVRVDSKGDRDSK